MSYFTSKHQEVNCGISPKINARFYVLSWCLVPGTTWATSWLSLEDRGSNIMPAFLWRLRMLGAVLYALAHGKAHTTKTLEVSCLRSLEGQGCREQFSHALAHGEAHITEPWTLCSKKQTRMFYLIARDVSPSPLWEIASAYRYTGEMVCADVDKYPLDDTVRQCYLEEIKATGKGRDVPSLLT